MRVCAISKTDWRNFRILFPCLLNKSSFFLNFWIVRESLWRQQTNNGSNYKICDYWIVGYRWIPVWKKDKSMLSDWVGADLHLLTMECIVHLVWFATQCGCVFCLNHIHKFILLYLTGRISTWSTKRNKKDTLAFWVTLLLWDVSILTELSLMDMICWAIPPYWQRINVMQTNYFKQKVFTKENLCCIRVTKIF